MGNYSRLIVSAAVFSLIVCNASTGRSQDIEPFAVTGAEGLGRSKADLPIGTILTSILPPPAFKAHMEVGEWVWAKGDKLTNQNSRLAIFMKLNRNSYYDPKLFDPQDTVSMPDLSGKFLRGIDFKDSEDGDVEKGRKIGTYQADGLKNHTHRLGHSFPTDSFNTHARAGNLAHTEEDWRSIYPNASEPSTKDTTEGGAETRPKNVAVYYYIRVN